MRRNEMGKYTNEDFCGSHVMGGGNQEVGIKRKEWLCTTGEYRESIMQVSDSSRRGGRSMEFSTRREVRVRALAEGKRDKRVHAH
jgi:hypothetical protein